MHILHVIGARPNFMKLAPVWLALPEHRGVRQTMVHTGQHYDVEMSAVFFKDLGLPTPDINLIDRPVLLDHLRRLLEVRGRTEPAAMRHVQTPPVGRALLFPLLPVPAHPRSRAEPCILLFPPW